jgi:hypothetical protein
MIHDYVIIRNAVPLEVCKLTAIEFELQEKACQVLYPGASMADLSPNSFARYSPLCFEALSVYLQPLIEKEVGFEIFPVYSYARIYYKGSRLDKHFDRRSSEVSISICIEKDPVDWALFIKSEDGAVHEVHLEVGDMVIYSGRAQEHWREEFKGEKQIQTFLQYVSANGKDSWLKWDTRPALGLPFEYAGPEVRQEMAKLIENNSKNY